MDIEEQIRFAKHYHNSLTIDIEPFKKCVLDASKNSLGGKKYYLWRSVKQKPFLTVLVAIGSMVVAGFTFSSLSWYGSPVHSNGATNELASMQTPLETWTNTIQDWHLPKPMTLSEARSIASFPIHAPTQIANWTRVQNFGWIIPFIMYHANGTVTHSHGSVAFLDFWDNVLGQKIAVEQTLLNISLGPQSSLGFPAGSDVINTLKPDLAVMMNLQKGRYDLAIEQKEGKNKIIEYDFYGTVSPSSLVSFAKTYLHSPTK